MNWFAVIAILLGAGCVVMGVTGSYANVWSFVTGTTVPIPGGGTPNPGGNFGGQPGGPGSFSIQQPQTSSISTGLQTHQAQ